jgi:membrane fusion protein, multidrug efflux system
MSEAISDDTAAAGNGAGGKRKIALAIVVGVFAVAGIACGAYWALVARYVTATDDAYVDGNVVMITPQVAGTVVAIDADDTQYVTAGRALVRLDRADAAVALRSAEAELAQTVRKVRSRYADAAQLEATVAGRETDLAKARADLARREHLAGSGAVADEDIQHAREAVHHASAALAAARQQLASDRAMTDETSIPAHPSVEHAAAQVRAAYLGYQRTELPAPVSGFVAKRSVQLGQRVNPGTALMAVVPLDQVWVDANFKEGQLASLRLGQPVTLTADANGVAYHGKIAGFGAGTGAAFALLPAQNATGNWIKVVQRLPVRIALEQDELRAHPLAIGLSMNVEVDVHDRSGAALTQQPAGGAGYRTTVFEQDAPAVDGLIADIIARNGGGRLQAGAPGGSAPPSPPVAQSPTIALPRDMAATAADVPAGVDAQ